jgi:hypothetical protein
MHSTKAILSKEKFYLNDLEEVERNSMSLLETGDQSWRFLEIKMIRRSMK